VGGAETGTVRPHESWYGRRLASFRRPGSGTVYRTGMGIRAAAVPSPVGCSVKAQVGAAQFGVGVAAGLAVPLEHRRHPVPHRADVPGQGLAGRPAEVVLGEQRAQAGLGAWLGRVEHAHLAGPSRALRASLGQVRVQPGGVRKVELGELECLYVVTLEHRVIENKS
jgi:hypothetical protein